MRVIPPITPIITFSTSTSNFLVSSTVPDSTTDTVYSPLTNYAPDGIVAAAAVSYGSAQTIYKSLQSGNLGNALTDTVWWKNMGIVYPAYASGSSCPLGGIVSNGRLLYESLVAANTGNLLNDATKWLPLGATNRWAMFDLSRNTKTSQPGSLTVVFSPGQRCNSIGLAGLVANSYSLTVTSVIGCGTVFTAAGSLNTRGTLSWSDYFFKPFSTRESLVFFNIPPYSDAIFTLVLTATTGDAQIGACCAGNFSYMGETQYSAVSDVVNYSTIERDTFGNAKLIPRRNVPKTNQVVNCAKANVNAMIKLRADLNAIPAMWYGLDDDTDGYFESLSKIGIYKSFSFNHDFPTMSQITIELEEI